MLQHFVISYYLKIKMPEGHCRIIKGGMCNGDLRRMHGEEKGERINVGIEGSADRDHRNHRACLLYTSSGIPGNGFPDFLAGVIFRWRLRFLLEGGIMRGDGGFIFI